MFEDEKSALDNCTALEADLSAIERCMEPEQSDIHNHIIHARTLVENLRLQCASMQFNVDSLQSELQEACTERDHYYDEMVESTDLLEAYLQDDNAIDDWLADCVDGDAEEESSDDDADWKQCYSNEAIVVDAGRKFSEEWFDYPLQSPTNAEGAVQVWNNTFLPEDLDNRG